MRYRSSFALTLALLAAPAAALVLIPRIARAEPEAPADEERPLPRPVRLEYVPAWSCTDPETVATTITNEISGTSYRDVFDRDAAARLLVTISRKGILYKATAEVRDEKGVTVWTHPFTPVRSCDMLMLGIGIVVGGRFSRPAPPPPSLPPPPPPPEPPSPPPPPPSPRPPTTTTTTPRLWGLRAAASGGVSRGASPAEAEAVFDLEAGGQWRFKPNWILSTSLGMLYRPHESARMPTPWSQVDIGTTLTTGVLAPCLHGRIVRVWAFGCAGMELGRLAATVTRNGRSSDNDALWAALDLRLGIEVPLGSSRRPHIPQFALRAYGEVPVLLQRPDALVEEALPMGGGKTTQVWATPAVTGSLSLGLLAWYDLR